MGRRINSRCKPSSYDLSQVGLKGRSPSGQIFYLFVLLLVRNMSCLRQSCFRLEGLLLCKHYDFRTPLLYENSIYLQCTPMEHSTNLFKILLSSQYFIIVHQNVLSSSK